MKNKTKKFILGGVISIGIVGGVFFAYLKYFHKETKAQQNVPTVTIVCNQPIPVGEVFDDSIRFLNEIYKIYQDTNKLLSLGISTLQSEIAKLEEGGEEICDFSKCQPQFSDTGLDIRLENTETGAKIAQTHIGKPKAEECSGTPCPDLDEFLKELETVKNGIEANYELLDNLFNNPVPFPKYLRKPEQQSQSSTTPLVLIENKLFLVREWLKASLEEEEEKSCVMTELEKKKAERGEIPRRFPMKCKEALKMGIYWPKFVPDSCFEKCKKFPLKRDCKSCMESFCQDRTYFSPLEKINCKIYVDCFQPCSQGIGPQCLDCLCCKNTQSYSGKCPKEDKLTEEECTAWICGGSEENWVCCYEILTK